MGSLPDFRTLVERNQSMVYSIALRALNQREMAEDLTQEVFLSLHENLASIESEDHARNWLRRTAANRSIDEIRRLKYRRGPALDQVAEPAVDAEESDPM
jgi:RNA polymerase sigma-70 factor, ECF subfamily